MCFLGEAKLPTGPKYFAKVFWFEMNRKTIEY